VQQQCAGPSVKVVRSGFPPKSSLCSTTLFNLLNIPPLEYLPASIFEKIKFDKRYQRDALLLVRGRQEESVWHRTLKTLSSVI
jgi:hypothetical protein